MAKHSIKDFKIGDKVYHLTNPRITMVAIEILELANNVSCRWLDKDGKVQLEQFMAEELGIIDDSLPTIIVGTAKRNNYY